MYYYMCLYFIGPLIRQRIAQCQITGNEAGGFHFSNAGELNPSVVIELNSVTKNGLRLLNMTSPPVINMYIQNTRMVTVANNFINDNAGGVFLNTTTFSLTNALYCNITNNVINYNTHGTPVHLEGKIQSKLEKYIRYSFISMLYEFILRLV